MRIRQLNSIDETRQLESLISDYVWFLSRDMDDKLGVSFDAAALLASSMNGLAKVVPPEGRSFVAETDGGEAIGMVFLRNSGADAMEIKRLYVRPEGRGTGAGRALVEAAVSEARTSGRKALRLDTTKNLEAAIGLYRSMGFRDCAPYPESDHYDDTELLPVMVFMELPL